MPVSAWLRNCWMPVVMSLRFCASACAAPMTADWLEYELGLVASACSALVKLL